MLPVSSPRRIVRIDLIQMEWVEMLLPYAKCLGAVTFAAVGNCWGGYMVMRLSSYAEFKAGKCFDGV